MFIYYKKIYLIIFLTLFSSMALASTPGTVVARDILFASTPTTDTLDSEPKLEAPKPTIDPAMYFELAYPVIGCQDTYTVQDRILLDVLYTNKLFGLATNDMEGLDRKVNEYRTYLTNSFQELQVILSTLKDLAVSEKDYPNVEERAQIIKMLQEEDLKNYSTIWNQFWMSHAQTPPDQFVMTLAKWTSDCFLKQADWRDKLNLMGKTDL